MTSDNTNTLLGAFVFLSFLCFALGGAIGYADGFHDAQKSICHASCGDYWTIEDGRCACLVKW